MATGTTDLYALGLSLDPSSMVQGATQSAQALDKVADSAEKAQVASDKVTKSADEQGKAHEDLGEAIDHHRIRLGLLERGFISLTSEMTGASHELLHMGSALAEFATGGEFLVGALAGITALSVAWDKLTEDTRKAREEAEKYAQSDAVLNATATSRGRLGLEPTLPSQSAQTAANNLEAIEALLRQGGAHTGAQLSELTQLDNELVDGKVSADEFEKSLKKLAEANPLFTNRIKESNDLAAAFSSAKIVFDQVAADWHNSLTMPPALVEADIGEVERLEAEWEKFGQTVKQVGEAADKTNASIFGSNLTNNGLVDSMGQMFKAMHAPGEQMAQMWKDDLKQVVELATPTVNEFVKSELEALARQEAAAQQAVERPFREAMREISHDFGNWFADILGGGSHAFQKLADSIRDTFAKLVAQLVEMKLAQAMLSPSALTALGIPLPPGAMQNHTQLFGALGIAGVGGTLGYGLGSTTSNGGLGVLGGAAGGAAAGALMGSVIPVVGTIAGGVIGGVVGAIGGFFGSAAKRHQEEVEAALKAEEEAQVQQSAHIRALQAEGRTYEAETAQLELQHMQELADAEQKHYDSATFAALQLAQAAEDAALAADQARRKQQEAADAIAQQGALFGQSPAEIQAQLAALYGFTGKTRDEILSQYTKYQPGQELTADQQSLNAAIQSYVSQYLQSPASSATLSSVSSISAAQSDVMVGLMTSQVMFLSRIATATESLAGTGGMLTPVTGGASSGKAIDKALASVAMTRRAAVGAVRTPSPT